MSKNEMLLARVAFEAYCEATGVSEDTLGRSLKEFFLSNELARDGWIAAVKALKKEFEIPMEKHCHLSTVHLCQHSRGSDQPSASRSE